MKLRNRVYFSIMHLYNKRKMFLISLSIMFVGFLVTFKVLCVYYVSNYNMIQLRNLFDNRSNNLYKIECGYTTMDMEYYEEYRDILLELKSDYSINIYEATNIYPVELFNDELIRLWQQKFPNEKIKTLDGKAVGSIPFLKIDNDLLYVADIKDENGEIVQLQTREDGSMEVAIGSLYKQEIDIGDTFSDRHTGQKYIVAYVLAGEQEWVSGTISDSSSLISLDEYFITSMDLQNCSDFGCMTYINDVYLYCNQDEAISQIGYIEDYALEKGVYIDILSFEEYVKKCKENNNDLYLFSLVLAVLMLITVLVTSIIFSVITWLLDYHDIGILYANGFLEKDLFQIIFQENILKLIVTMLLSCAYICLFEMGTGLSKIYLYEIFGFIIILYSIVMILCSLGTYYLINKYAPAKLMKGETI